MTFEEVRTLALDLPEVSGGTSWGRATLKVRGRVMAMLREEKALAIKIDIADKEFLMRTRPTVFYSTPHYDGYPAVLVRLDKVKAEEMRQMITACWRFVAPKRLVAEYDAGRGAAARR